MNLKEILSAKIPKEALESFSGRFEVTGDIAVLNIPPPCRDFREEIADALLEMRRDVNTVLEKTSPLSGENRTAKYRFIAGERRTHTLHKEAGYTYKIDLSSVFFSPKLCFERMRIASQVNSSEMILVPFAGAGPFAISAGSRGRGVVAVDKNPDACRIFRKNLEINSMKDKGDIICGDALDIPLFLREDVLFDRSIVPTAYGLDSALFKIAPLVRKGGIIHFYTFKPKEKIPGLLEGFGEKGLTPVFYRRCGNVAPGICRWVFDLKKA